MAAAAGIIQANLTRCQTAIFSKLAYCPWVDCNHMGAHISCKAFSIHSTTLDQTRHVTIRAADIKGGVGGIVLELWFHVMAILAKKARGLQTFKTHLNHTGMWIMAGENIP